MAWTGNAPVAFSPVNLSSAAAASTPRSPASAAAESKPWAMRYSRGDRFGNTFFLKPTLLCNPLMPITFILIFPPFIIERSRALFSLTASKPGLVVSHASCGNRVSFQFRQHLVRFLNKLRAGIEGHCLTQGLFALVLFFELIVGHPQIVIEISIRRAFSGAFFQQLRGPLEVSTPINDHPQRPCHLGIVGKGLTRLQGRFIGLLVVSQTFGAKSRQEFVCRRKCGETGEGLFVSQLRSVHVALLLVNCRRRH